MREPRGNYYMKMPLYSFAVDIKTGSDNPR